MAYTELYCDAATGDNLNGGAPIGGVYPLTYAAGTFVRATGVFTVASGNPQTDGVTVGDFASIYTTAGATVATFIARVTARDATTITVSLTAKAGVVTSVDEGAGAATCKVGGPWKGPNGAVGFPFTLAMGGLRNAAGNLVRRNFKNNATYSVTAAITAVGDANYGEINQGYTTTPGDGGRATIDGGTSGASYVLFTDARSYGVFYADLIFDHNGSTGNANLASITAAYAHVWRCVFANGKGTGLVPGPSVFVQECEAYGNGVDGFTANGSFSRCISHNNTGSGWLIGSTTYDRAFDRCIAESNGGKGMSITGIGGAVKISNCDFYNNGSDGLLLSGVYHNPVYIENCNFVKNGGYGINFGTDISIYGFRKNCAFGAGTQANASGTVNNPGMLEDYGDTSVTYPANVTPWVDPANGDFRINLAEAIGAGRGAFTQTAASYTGAVSYPVIGACQPAVTLPAAANVRLSGSSQYGYAGALYDGTISMPNSGTPTGTEDEISDACVVSGKNYGAGNARTGTAPTGGTGGSPSFGGKFSRRV